MLQPDHELLEGGAGLDRGSSGVGCLLSLSLLHGAPSFMSHIHLPKYPLQEIHTQHDILKDVPLLVHLSAPDGLYGELARKKPEPSAKQL